MIKEKKYIKARSVAEALDCASKSYSDFRFIAGGTDVMPNKFQGNDASSCLIDLTGIKEMYSITESEEMVSIGSLAKLEHISDHPFVKAKFPALAEAARAVATPVLRKSATLAGNLLCENRCIFYNQSEWWREAVGYCLKCDGDICIATGGKKACFSKMVSDTAPVLIALNAMLQVASRNGSRLMPVEDLYSGDGLTPRTIAKDEIILAINIPVKPATKCVFKKLRPRKAVDFTSLTTAVSLSVDGSVKIVLGGVDPKAVVVRATVKDDMKEIIKSATKKSRIVDNDFYSRIYRKEMIGVFLAQSFKELKIKF